MKYALKLFCAVSFATLMLSPSVSRAQQCVEWDEAYKQAEALLQKLTLDEKVHFTRGYEQFFFYGVPDKGIPYVYLTDATQGVHLRSEMPESLIKQPEKTTSFPCPIMLAATFDVDMADRYGRSVGEECRAGGIEVLLGPGVNITKNSQCGRNFEYFSEDPLLSSAMAASYIRGLQSTGTAACVKHFIGNETEFYRRRSNSVIGERALHEIYLPPFHAAVDAGVAYIMASYNQLNGEWTGQSDFVNKHLIRDVLGFRGCIMSDWKSVYDTEKVVLNGVTVEMPGRAELYDEIHALIKEGRLTEADIDRMILPNIATSIAYGLYNREKYRPELFSTWEEHERTANEIAAAGTVLLRNNGVLPLAEGRKLLVAGKFVDEVPSTSNHRSASAYVEGYNNITLREALAAEFGAECVEVVEKPTDEQLASADVVLISAGTYDIESFERPFALPKDEESLIRRAVEKNPNTIVLVNSGSGIRMTAWNDKAAAVVYGWYPGQNGQTALAGILSGRLNPSGKLPLTIEREFADSPAKNVIPEGGRLYNLAPYAYNESLIRVYDVNYDEGVLVGYRWYESKNIKPLYAFGHGLSYTDFALSKAVAPKNFPKEKPLKVAVTLTNTGKREGAEVVQLYVSEDAPTVERPLKELKAFKKVKLAAGESRRVEFELSRKDLAFWCDKKHDWQVNAGKYTLSIGTSSDNIAHTLAVNVE